MPSQLTPGQGHQGTAGARTAWPPSLPETLPHGNIVFRGTYKYQSVGQGYGLG